MAGYEEGKKAVHEKLALGYPRFVYHPYVVKVVDLFRSKHSLRDGQDALPFPNKEVADRWEERTARATRATRATHGTARACMRVRPLHYLTLAHPLSSTLTLSTLPSFNYQVLQVRDFGDQTDHARVGQSCKPSVVL